MGIFTIGFWPCIPSKFVYRLLFLAQDALGSSLCFQETSDNLGEKNLLSPIERSIQNCGEMESRNDQVLKHHIMLGPLHSVREHSGSSLQLSEICQVI